MPQDKSLADAVSEILHVSSDSAYRRIRGETPMVLEEATLLCDHFHISLDQLLSVKSGFTLFETERIDDKDFTFRNYLKRILQQLEEINGFAKKEIIYLSRDLPFFHNFSSEPLFAFHYFFWMKSVIRHPEFEKQKFRLDCLSPEIKDLGKEILRVYNNIPSTEIWNTECVNPIIFQVEYFKEAGYFKSPGDIRAVYESIEATIDHLKDQAENGCKFMVGEEPQLKKDNFKFFYNRITLADNLIMMVTNQFKTVLLKYDVLNYLVTRDETFCSDAYRDLQAQIRHSTQISSTSEKQRNIFFRVISEKIQDRKKHL